MTFSYDIYPRTRNGVLNVTHFLVFASNSMNQHHKHNTIGVLDKTDRIRRKFQNISREWPATGATTNLSLLFNKTRARRSTHYTLAVLTTTQLRLTTAVTSQSTHFNQSNFDNYCVYCGLSPSHGRWSCVARNNVCTCGRKGHLSHIWT